MMQVMNAITPLMTASPFPDPGVMSAGYLH
jgi:hypothetical protein